MRGVFNALNVDTEEPKRSCCALRGGDGCRHSRRRFDVLQKRFGERLTVNIGCVLVFATFSGDFSGVCEQGTPTDVLSFKREPY